MRVDDPSGGGPKPLLGHPPPGRIARAAARASRSMGLVLRGFALTLHGDVMTGTALERDVLVQFDRLPDGLLFG